MQVNKMVKPYLNSLGDVPNRWTTQIQNSLNYTVKDTFVPNNHQQTFNPGYGNTKAGEPALDKYKIFAPKIGSNRINKIPQVAYDDIFGQKKSLKQLASAIPSLSYSIVQGPYKPNTQTRGADRPPTTKSSENQIPYIKLSTALQNNNQSTGEQSSGTNNQLAGNFASQFIGAVGNNLFKLAGLRDSNSIKTEAQLTNAQEPPKVINEVSRSAGVPVQDVISKEPNDNVNSVKHSGNGPEDTSAGDVFYDAETGEETSETKAKKFLPKAQPGVWTIEQHEAEKKKNGLAGDVVFSRKTRPSNITTKKVSTGVYILSASSEYPVSESEYTPSKVGSLSDGSSSFDTDALTTFLKDQELRHRLTALMPTGTEEAKRIQKEAKREVAEALLGRPPDVTDLAMMVELENIQTKLSSSSASSPDKVSSSDSMLGGYRHSMNLNEARMNIPQPQYVYKPPQMVQVPQTSVNQIQILPSSSRDLPDMEIDQEPPKDIRNRKRVSYKDDSGVSGSPTSGSEYIPGVKKSNVKKPVKKPVKNPAKKVKMK